MKNILVFGATSGIAQAFCQACAAPGVRFNLMGRDAERLQIVADDLLARGAQRAGVRAVRSGEYGDLVLAVENVFREEKQVDLLFVAQGSLPSQEECEEDPALVEEILRVNTSEVMQVCLLVANKFEQQKQGMCVVLGSVAGDRGRRGNYVYGAAKAALEAFCDGLHQRLSPQAGVLLVKPGPVDTPMTAHLNKGALFTTPNRVAADIIVALRKKRKRLYTPFFWRWIMLLIKFLPGSLVKRMKA